MVRFVYGYCIAHQNCVRDFFKEHKPRAEESFRSYKYTQKRITQPLHSESEYTIVASSFDCSKCKSIILFRMQSFVLKRINFKLHNVKKLL